MRSVPKEEFFRAINPLDVHPRVDSASLKDRHHLSYWEMQQTRQLIGKSVSDSWVVEPTQFFLVGG